MLFQDKNKCLSSNFAALYLTKLFMCTLSKCQNIVLFMNYSTIYYVANKWMSSQGLHYSKNRPKSVIFYIGTRISKWIDGDKSSLEIGLQIQHALLKMMLSVEFNNLAENSLGVTSSSGICRVTLLGICGEVEWSSVSLGPRSPCTLLSDN